MSAVPMSKVQDIILDLRAEIGAVTVGEFHPSSVCHCVASCQDTPHSTAEQETASWKSISSQSSKPFFRQIDLIEIPLQAVSPATFARRCLEARMTKVSPLFNPHR